MPPADLSGVKSSTMLPDRPGFLQGLTAAPRLPLDISERKVLLNWMDLAAVNGALAAVARWAGTPVRQPLFFVGLSALWLLFAWSLDAYDLSAAGQWPVSVRRVSAAALLTYAVGLPILYLASVGLRSWLSLGLLLGLSELWLALERGLYVLALRQPAFRRRTLVIGAGDSGHLLTEALAASRDPCYEILGFIDDDPAKQDLTIPVAPNPPHATRNTQHATWTTLHVSSFIPRQTGRFTFHRSSRARRDVSRFMPHATRPW